MISIALKSKKKFKSKLIYDCYEYWIGSALSEKRFHSAGLYLVLELIAAKYVDSIILVYENNPIKKLILNKKKINIIYNIPKNDNIRASSNDEINLSNLKIHKNDFIIGYLGIIMKQKGYNKAIESLLYLDESYKLLLVGDARDTNFRSYIYNLIREKNLEDRVIITGILSYKDAMEYASLFNIGLILFDNTQWTKYSTPNKLFEYMSLGIPILASNLPNLRLFIDKYNCGIITSFTNPKELAIAISNIKENADLHKLKSNGKKAFDDYFTEDKQMEKFLKIYSNLLT